MNTTKRRKVGPSPDFSRVRSTEQASAGMRRRFGSLSAPGPRALLIALFLGLTVSLSASAQGFRGLDDVDATGLSYHRFVRPGQPEVQIMLLGNGVMTGIYVLGDDVDFAQLIALSGITLGGTDGRTEVTVRLYRPTGAERQLVAEAEIEEVILRPSSFPTFQDGDIVYVEAVTKSRPSAYEVVRTISSIVTLGFVVERIVSSIR